MGSVPYALSELALQLTSGGRITIYESGQKETSLFVLTARLTLDEAPIGKTSTVDMSGTV